MTGDSAAATGRSPTRALASRESRFNRLGALSSAAFWLAGAAVIVLLDTTLQLAGTATTVLHTLGTVASALLPRVILPRMPTYRVAEAVARSGAQFELTACGGDAVAVSEDVADEFRGFVGGRWQAIKALTGRPPGLEDLSAPQAHQRSAEQEDRINRLGRAICAVVWVAGGVAVISHGGRGDVTVPMLLRWYVSAVIVSAFVPRFLIRKIGDLRDRGAIAALALTYGLTTDSVSSPGERVHGAWGVTDDTPWCIMQRKSTADWKSTHMFFAAPCPIDTHGRWRPRASLLTRKRGGRFELPDAPLMGFADIEGPVDADDLQHPRLLALMDGAAQRAIIELVLRDVVLQLRDGRLEAFFNTIQQEPSDLEEAVTELLELRTHLLTAAAAPLPERLLHLVLNADEAQRHQCLAALRRHFPGSSELERAEHLLGYGASGHLSLADDAGGELSVAHDAGALQLVPKGT